MDYKIICGDCETPLVVSNSTGIREHATGTYSFLCRNCHARKE